MRSVVRCFARGLRRDCDGVKVVLEPRTQGPPLTIVELGVLEALDLSSSLDLFHLRMVWDYTRSLHVLSISWYLEQTYKLDPWIGRSIG